MSVARPLVPKRARWIAAGLRRAARSRSRSAAYLYERHRTGSIYHPHARFIPQPTPTPARSADPNGSPGRSTATPTTTPASSPRPRACSRPSGAVGTQRHSLLEFPPVIYGDHIFQLADDGMLARSTSTPATPSGSRRIGSLSASTPAVIGQPVYATVLARTTGVPGDVFALDYATGQIRWWRELPEPQRVLAARRPTDASTSAPRTAPSTRSTPATAQSSGPTTPKAPSRPARPSPAECSTSATTPATSRRSPSAPAAPVWSSGSGGALLGSGTFYSTAAVIYGRVFLGNTDGRVYAYDASTGRLDWAVQTGAYVYASPAVANAPGLGPTIYVGSYDGTFYALNARSGTCRVGIRRARAHLRLGDDRRQGRLLRRPRHPPHLRPRHLDGTIGLRGEHGSFDPVISDGQDIYLTGYTGLYGLAPR